jgi:3-keto-disaccharide hydrolase
MTRPAAAFLFRATFALTATAAAITACASQKSSAADSAAADSTRTSAAQASASADTAWRPLVGDSSTTTAWRGYKKEDFPKDWTIANGVLSKTGTAEDLITRDQFGDFELEWDWKVAPGGNAGVFYRASEEYDKVYWSAPEYQLLDDAKHADGKTRLTSAGADYEIYPSPAGYVKPGGEWNSSRIVARGPHIEHWLNGQKLLEYEAGSPDWTAKVKASKFATYKNYGVAKSGHIAIQGDHEGPLSIRNMRIREIR